MFDYSTFPVLTTERLLLRELRIADASDLLVFRGDPIVQRYNSRPLHDLEEAETAVQRTHAAYSTKKELAWGVALKGSDRVVGGVGIYNWSRHHRRAEIGYDLARIFWGRGFGSEAVRAVIGFGFEQMALHRIYASTIADNHKSVRMLERIGFVREGTQREYSWEEDGTFHDSAMYGLLKREFQP